MVWGKTEEQPKCSASIVPFQYLGAASNTIGLQQLYLAVDTNAA